MSEETKGNIATAATNIWSFRITIILVVLSSLVSLGTAILAALTGATWNLLDGQSKFMICVAIFVNWGGSLIGYISKNAKAIESGDVNDITSIPNPSKTP